MWLLGKCEVHGLALLPIDDDGYSVEAKVEPACGDEAQRVMTHDGATSLWRVGRLVQWIDFLTERTIGLLVIDGVG